MRKRENNLVLDVQMGIAGDMFLSSLIDLVFGIKTVERENLIPILERCAAPMAEVEVDIKQGNISGIKAIGVEVIRDTAASHRHVIGREMSEYLKAGCKQAGLAGNGEEYASQVLKNILDAESKIHRSSPEELHLHETGAPDTLVEIIGSAYLLEELGAFDTDFSIFSTPVSVGMGSVAISHGTVPVPAPATMEILKEMPFKFGPVNGELATPTGVSLLKGLTPEFITNFSDIRIVSKEIGYGFGKRKFNGKYVNVMRAILSDMER